MSRSAGIELEGAARFRRTLRQAGRDLETLDGAHSTAADTVAGKARSLAPRRTGTLAGSISGTREAGAATITATAGHARPIHAGVPSRGITARPFLTDAARQTQPRWLSVYAAAVDKALTRIRGI